MNPKGKKIITLFLVFYLMVLSGSLYAKKKGAELIIQKIGGGLLKGELIAVKKNSLLLLEVGIDVSVDIKEIRVIIITKKSKAGTGALYGLLIGGGAGALIFRQRSDLEDESNDMKRDVILLGGLIGGASGALIGGITGAIAGKDKPIQIEGISQEEMELVLEKLRKKARIPDYK